MNPRNTLRRLSSLALLLLATAVGSSLDAQSISDILPGPLRDVLQERAQANAPVRLEDSPQGTAPVQVWPRQIPPRPAELERDAAPPGRFQPGDEMVLLMYPDDSAKFQAPQGDLATVPAGQWETVVQPAAMVQTAVSEPLRGADYVESLTAQERSQRKDFREKLNRKNPYEIEMSGNINLPVLGPVFIFGLSVEEVVIRLQAIHDLSSFNFTVTRLPKRTLESAQAMPFGYDVFGEYPRASGDDLLNFAPNTQIPIPLHYTIGPGDEVHLQLFGNTDGRFILPVSRDGTINLPEIGPISVVGFNFEQLREEVQLRIKAHMIGVDVSITLGKLRSTQVFVLGDVVRPGSYTVSAFYNMTSAILESGGIKTIGSLRRVQLRRAGETVSTLDLYDLLLRGDTHADSRLEPGDVIFVPPVGDRVSVTGQVKRPGLYEMLGPTTLSEAIDMAGGLQPRADTANISLRRVEARLGTVTLDIDLANEGQDLVSDGDEITVPHDLGQLWQHVRLEGHVFEPKTWEWHPGMRLTDLIPSPEVLRPQSDINYLVIRREVEANIRIKLVSADLEAAWAAPGSEADIALEPRDTVHVLSFDVNRGEILRELFIELETQGEFQGKLNQPFPVATITGAVRVAGDYPVEPAMRITDLIRAAGGLTDLADTQLAMLSRQMPVADTAGRARESVPLNVHLGEALAGDAAANILLQPYDQVEIRQVSDVHVREFVQVSGEVLYPGTYALSRGERLSSLLRRAGGLTPEAFPEGSIFLREELRRREQQQLNNFASRIERRLTNTSATATDTQAFIRFSESVLAQIRSTEPTGRLVIDLKAAMGGEPVLDVILQDQDRLIVPFRSQEVSVLGEVQFPTAHLFDPELSRDDYIARSGGLTRQADRWRIYTVRANGEVIVHKPKRTLHFFRKDLGGQELMRTGDVIVVPFRVRLVQPLAFWSNITQILSNMSIVATVVTRFQ